METLSREALRQVGRHYGTPCKALVESAVEEGARVRYTKSGLRLLFPSGGAVGLHYTPSDRRAGKNAISAIRREMRASREAVRQSRQAGPGEPGRGAAPS